MFRYESEMIPILKDCLAKIYNTNHFIGEFKTGNGIADLVFTTEFNSESLFFSDYKMMSIFISYINGKEKITKNKLCSCVSDKKALAQLLDILEREMIISWKGDDLIQIRPYNSHTKNLISIEAKLKDWKGGFYQAMRYKFYSQKSFLAISKQFAHRVDQELFRSNGVGLISVCRDNIEILIDPCDNNNINNISYCHLSESFMSKLLIS